MVIIHYILSNAWASNFCNNAADTFQFFPSFPAGICGGCHLLLFERCNGEKIIFPNVDYENKILPRVLRSSSTNPCTCHICIVATPKCKDALSMKKKATTDRIY